MSTVHECLTAHQCGMSVFAFSLITNLCVMSDEGDEEADVDEVIETGKARENDLKRMVTEMVKVMNSSE